LWIFPQELVEAADDAPVLQLVTTKVADPERFMARVHYLYEHKEEKSREEILLKMAGSSTDIQRQCWMVTEDTLDESGIFRDITEPKADGRVAQGK